MNRVTLRCNNRADWLSYRKPDITSTDTAALFGLSPYKTKFELYHKHASGIVLEVKKNTGRATEDQLRFIEAVRAKGGRAGVARSVEDAIRILEG